MALSMGALAGQQRWRELAIFSLADHAWVARDEQGREPKQFQRLVFDHRWLDFPHPRLQR